MSQSPTRKPLGDISTLHINESSPVHPHRDRSKKKKKVRPAPKLFNGDSSVNAPFISPVREHNSDEPRKLNYDIQITLKSTRIHGYFYFRYDALNRFSR